MICQIIMGCMPDYPGDLFVALRSAAVVADSIGGAATYARAARALHVDESVLRRRILALGEHVGAPLFEGRGASLRLTATGERVIEAADSIARTIDSLRAPLPMRLSIGCTGTVSRELLPAVLAHLHGKYPDLVVHVRRAGAEAGLAGIADGSLDLAIVRSAAAPRAVEARFVADDALWLAVPKGHPLIAMRGFDPARVARFPLIGFRPGSSTRARVLRVLEPFGGAVRIEVDGRSLALRYVELGMGIALVSGLRDRKAPKHAGVVFRDVTRHFDAAKFFVVWRSGRALSPWEERVVERLEVS
jgi:DNA-binding transcriptional LysR family regulator